MHMHIAYVCVYNDGLQFLRRMLRFRHLSHRVCSVALVLLLFTQKIKQVTINSLVVSHIVTQSEEYWRKEVRENEREGAVIDMGWVRD